MRNTYTRQIHWDGSIIDGILDEDKRPICVCVCGHNDLEHGLTQKQIEKQAKSRQNAPLIYDCRKPCKPHIFEQLYAER